MIVVDTSVLIALLTEEQDASALVERMGAASRRYVSAGSMLECGIVVAANFGAAAWMKCGTFTSVSKWKLFLSTSISRGLGMALFAARTWQQAPRPLNFGDCFAYALARTRNLPLLFKGNDFVHTDIEPARKPA